MKNCKINKNKFCLIGPTNLTFCILLFGLTSCKKFVETPPPVGGIVGTEVYNTNSTATAVLAGMFQNFAGAGTFNGGTSSISLTTSLASDELVNYYNPDISLNEFYTNSLKANMGSVGNWSDLYKYIYQANAVIIGLNSSSGVTPAVKQQLLGEAEFLRAFYYFYLVNLFGDVPLVTSTNYQVNELASRTSSNLVYQQIVSDLKGAINSLSDNYLAPDAATVTTEKTIPNKAAATALLARVYLYLKDYTDAEQTASTVINSGAYSLDNDLTQVFLANSSEAIWQIQPPNNNSFDTFDGNTYILTDVPNYQSPVALNSALINAFEPGDLRFTNWIGNFQTYHFPYKYKIKDQNSLSEYEMVIRLAELYLIRAEAEANNNEFTAAISDINIIRNRAGLANYGGSTDLSSLMNVVLQERKVELFTEWGHRWLDLKRTGTINSVMGSPGNICASKGGTWQPTDELFPIPLSEIKLDKNLTQNPGY